MLDVGGLNSGVYTVKVILVHEERVVLRREVDSGLGELEENAAIEAHDEEDPPGSADGRPKISVKKDAD
jgi:hypothetical protein